MTVLQSKNLTLRPCSPDDRDDFMDLERDPAVMRFLNGGHAVDQMEGDPDSLFLMPRGREEHVWTARSTVGGGFIGWFCLWPNGNREAELGYRLRRAAWGRGLASEGARAVIHWGFSSGRYDTVVACTMAAHGASRRVLEKAGLRLVRTVAVDWAEAIPGGEQGEVHYAMARPGGSG